MNKTLSRPQLVPVYCVGAGMKSTQFQFNDLDIIRTLKRDISFLAQPMHNLSIIGTTGILSVYWYMAIKYSKRKEMNDFYVKQSSIPCSN